MLYVRDISTAAGTVKASATVTRIKAWSGVVTKISVMFPPGCTLLLHCAIKIGGHQIFPVDHHYDVVGDNEVVETQEYLQLASGWNDLSIYTWNDDTSYAHKCIVRISVLPAGIADPFNAMQDIALSLRLMLRRLGILR